VVRIVISWFHMSLAKKFVEASACHTVKIGSLDTEKPYPITHAKVSANDSALQFSCPFVNQSSA
jgi:hypothetical protein